MQRIGLLLACFSCIATSCLGHKIRADEREPFLVVLGTAQDGGYPQAGCQKPCCSAVWEQPKLRRFVSSVAVVDPARGERWLFDCSPDFRDQLQLLQSVEDNGAGAAPISGVFPTHAHVGHYAGLIHLGREVMGAKQVPVYAMPRMKYFLETNGPWDQLVKLQQIEVKRMAAGEPVAIGDRMSVRPFLVPHRDEYSETVGFLISGPKRSALYLPDIDKWERWNVRIEDYLAQVDIAFLDGTFFSAGELPGRNMDEIPHPFIEESMQRFAELPASEREKIHFIHLNHSNPALRVDSDAARRIVNAGFSLAVQGTTHPL